MGNLHKIKQKIAEKKPVIGLFVTMADITVSEMAGWAGFDFVWLDSEHAPLDRREILQHIIAAQGAGISAFVRVPGVDPDTVKAILDMGPDGVIFPFIDSGRKAQLAVQSCQYPPKGIRGQGPVRAIRYGLDDEEYYIQNFEHDFWKILQVENMTGYENLDEILATPGFDSLFIGQADLGRSMNLSGDARQEAMKQTVDDICRRAASIGLIVGTAAGYKTADLQALQHQGIQWMAVAQDSRLLSGAMRSIVAERDHRV